SRRPAARSPRDTPLRARPPWNRRHRSSRRTQRRAEAGESRPTPSRSILHGGSRFPSSHPENQRARPSARNAPLSARMVGTPRGSARAGTSSAPATLSGALVTGSGPRRGTRSQRVAPEGAARPVLADRSSELRTDELRAGDREAVGLPTNDHAFDRAAADLGRGREQPLDPGERETPLRDPRHRMQPERAQEGIPPRSVPELAGGAIVDVESEEPVRQSLVHDAVDRVAPLAEEHPVRT